MLDQEATLYIRELPGGGYVSIQSEQPDDASAFHAALCVERRSVADRRDGHPPPIVLESTGGDRQSVFDRLVEIANSNVAVAAALLRWQAGRGSSRDV
ncbi:MAG: hypothetical protein ACYC2G_17685 [Gemmatimonadaceae bacterium]